MFCTFGGVWSPMISWENSEGPTSFTSSGNYTTLGTDGINYVAICSFEIVVSQYPTLPPFESFVISNLPLAIANTQHVCVNVWGQSICCVASGGSVTGIHEPPVDGDVYHGTLIYWGCE